MEKPKTELNLEWLIRPSKTSKENCIIESDRLLSVLPVAQAHGIEITLLANPGEPYPASNYWHSATDYALEGAIHTGKGQINDGIVPEDSVYVKLSGKTTRNLNDFWNEVRAREQEARAKKVGTKA